MAIPTTAILPSDSGFNTVASYYGMFPYEMSESKVQSLNIKEVKRVRGLTFEKLLDTMIDERLAKPSIDTYLVVAHGFHDASDYAYGLTMPITDKSTMKTIEDVLAQLLKLLNRDASEADMAAYEKDPQITINHTKPTLPKGSVSRIVGKMRKLRDLKVRRVEFRACALGTNPSLLETIGQCFGARWVYAPDVHMFYVRATPGHTVRDASLDGHLRAHGDARVFTNGGQRLALQVQGMGVARSTWTETTDTNLRWFADKYIWDTNNYPRGTQAPAALFVAGMDLKGSSKRYALPQESEYSSHLIYKGPLAGNKI